MGNSNDKKDKIGLGIYGETVKVTYGHSIRVAQKIIDLDDYFNKIGKNIQQREKENYYNKIKSRISEIRVLEGNKNINKYYHEEIQIEDGKLLFLMDLCNYNLIDYLKDNKGNDGFDIGEIYDLLNQLNNIFKIMSQRNINNGNIKLQNILVNFENNNVIFKLTGFEIIPELLKYTKLNLPDKICIYLPPEILKENNRFQINQKTDLWSLGVIIYYLFFREFPFKVQNSKDVLNEIQTTNKKKTNFIELDNLIDGLLKVNIEQRLNWEEYFNHPFFKNDGFWKKYNIINKIGESEFSTVYKAVDKTNGNNVALKVINFTKIEELEKDKNIKSKIIEEIKEKIDQMIKLGNDNPINFVNVYEKFEIENGIAFTMELFDCNLKNYVNNNQIANESDIFLLLIELNKTFNYLLQKNIIIGNLKLENIFIKRKNPRSSEYIFKFSDVGLCPNLIKFIIKYSKTKESVIYLSPELNQKEKYDNINDLWSLGIIIHYFKFRCFPYEANSFNKIINLINSKENHLKKSKNEIFNFIIEGLLQKDPNKRLNWDDYFNQFKYSLYYELIEENLIEGNYYEIYKAKERKTGIERMIKIIDIKRIKDQYKEDNLKTLDEHIIKKFVEFLVKQTEVMKLLEEDGYNENTIKFFEYFNNEKEFSIVLEKYDSDLSHYFTNRKENYSVEEIRDLLKQLNNTLKLMSEKNIIHGDLNLENILYKKKGNKLIYKLSNYGMDKEFLNLIKIISPYKGKILYMAPEVLKGDLNVKSDLWSLGVIIYSLIFREKPYKGNDDEEILKNIDKEGQKKLKSCNNSELDHLIRSLLTSNLEERINWDQYFEHPFLVGGDFWKFYNDKVYIGEEPYFKVYEVKLKSNNEKRAIKVINLKIIRKAIENEKGSPCTKDDLKIYIDDFIKETQYMELLQGPNKDNINTLIFYEYFQTENEFCIVRELMGDNLNKFLFKKGKLNVKEIYDILIQLNNTFKILYDNNLSHKNLRLENILTKKKEGEKEEYIFKLIGLEFNTKVYELLGRGGIRINERYKAPEILHGDFINQDI